MFNEFALRHKPGPLSDNLGNPVAGFQLVMGRDDADASRVY